jgi:hypothetical protein
MDFNDIDVDGDVCPVLSADAFPSDRPKPIDTEETMGEKTRNVTTRMRGRTRFKVCTFQFWELLGLINALEKKLNLKRLDFVVFVTLLGSFDFLDRFYEDI